MMKPEMAKFSYGKFRAATNRYNSCCNRCDNCLQRVRLSSRNHYSDNAKLSQFRDGSSIRSESGTMKNLRQRGSQSACRRRGKSMREIPIFPAREMVSPDFSSGCKWYSLGPSGFLY